MKFLTSLSIVVVSVFLTGCGGMSHAEWMRKRQEIPLEVPEGVVCHKSWSESHSEEFADITPPGGRPSKSGKRETHEKRFRMTCDAREIARGNRR